MRFSDVQLTQNTGNQDAQFFVPCSSEMCGKKKKCCKKYKKKSVHCKKCPKL